MDFVKPCHLEVVTIADAISALVNEISERTTSHPKVRFRLQVLVSGPAHIHNLTLPVACGVDRRLTFCSTTKSLPTVIGFEKSGCTLKRPTEFSSTVELNLSNCTMRCRDAKQTAVPFLALICPSTSSWTAGLIAAKTYSRQDQRTTENRHPGHRLGVEAFRWLRASRPATL